MNIGESLRIALRGLGANKLRAALTMLGIIIGVGAVITLLSVGQGVSGFVTDSLQSIGSNLLFVMGGNLEDMSSGGGMRRMRSAGLTSRDATALSDPLRVPDAAAVAPVNSGTGQVEYGKTVIATSIVGVTPAYADVRSHYPAAGDFITQDMVDSSQPVAVLGWTLSKRLFPDDVYPVGQNIRINRVTFRVIGVMEEKGGSNFQNPDNEVLVPLTTAQRRLFPQSRSLSGQPLVDIVYVQVVSEDRMGAATQQISDVLREQHRLGLGVDDDFTIINQADLISIFGQITGLLTVFLGAIAAISLLVGGIGIMNIMLVSVTERTREIGIRKAVGAKRRDILLQFLIEAMVMSLIGGAIGIALGVVGAAVVSSLAEGLTAKVTIQSILLATGFSAAVGLFFGIYPATRAARLHPIDALRYE